MEMLVDRVILKENYPRGNKFLPVDPRVWERDKIREKGYCTLISVTTLKRGIPYVLSFPNSVKLDLSCSLKCNVVQVEHPEIGFEGGKIT